MPIITDETIVDSNVHVHGDLVVQGENVKEALYDIDDRVTDIEKDIPSLTPTYLRHHIVAEGTSYDGFPYAISFDLVLSTKVLDTNLEKFSQIRGFKFITTCTGFYINFNVDLIDIDNGSIRYYQNGGIVEQDIGKFTEDEYVKYFNDFVQEID